MIRIKGYGKSYTVGLTATIQTENGTIEIGQFLKGRQPLNFTFAVKEKSEWIDIDIRNLNIKIDHLDPNDWDGKFLHVATEYAKKCNN